MKKIVFTLFCLSTLIGLSQPFGGAKMNLDSIYQSQNVSKSAGCAPASSSIYMELNNVSALIHTGGNLWQIRSQNRSQYEVPKGSGIMSLFASALWLGGVDVNGQLKLAALRYRNGNDYWTGPLSNNAAEISIDDCLKYDRFYSTTQDEIRTFDAWYTAGLEDAQNGTNTQSENFPNYTVPDIITEWPAHGDPGSGQGHFLAPFYDRNGDTQYNPEDGDYPWYDFKKDIDCQQDRRVSIYGDENHWWIMNDKGNIHTETGADPIGMEVRAQAFAFATNDEINNMTFYNYELINRSTQSLNNTFFGIFIDVALGGAFDDYVGCDVSRGLGYAYNGNAVDLTQSGFLGYGENPPAVGVDFFEGPYQDNDGIDNAIGIGPNEAVEGNGIGFGDGIPDNERFGMRRFLYYNNLGAGNINQTDPINATDYYNYMQGYWKDGTRFVYGGSGHVSDPDANASLECDFMFPGDSDSLGWGTGGQPQPTWTEQTAGNFPYDRRFVQSAGPFKLEPGAVNNITVGVVWARAQSGDPFASVKELQKADDKAQALFENCFKVIEGPHAPDLEIQELENELILTLHNPVGSNNQREDYQEEDPFIIVDPETGGDNIYRFQGYQIFQVKDPTVSVSELDNNDLARLAFQCDIQDGVTQLVNWELDKLTGVLIPEIKVVGQDQGLRHSFSAKKDLFAQGDDQLVNHKSYHYIAIAYAHNNYKDYIPTDGAFTDGQKKPYLGSRKATVGEVKVITGIPHNPTPEADGTYQLIGYGEGPEITRIEGTGNGGRELNLTDKSIDYIVENNIMDHPVYKGGQGPIDVKVVDPLNVKPGRFVLRFDQNNDNLEIKHGRLKWYVERYEGTEGNYILAETVHADTTIEVANEQIIPDWGISISIEQFGFRCPENSGLEPEQCAPDDRKLYAITSSIIFEDSAKIWLSGIYDGEGDDPTNWISSGIKEVDISECGNWTGDPNFDPCNFIDNNYDNDEFYEHLLDGAIAPYKLINNSLISGAATGTTTFWNAITSAQKKSSLERINSIDIVLTNDKEKWTRASVIEMSHNNQWTEGNAGFLELRESPSVDKQGKRAGDPSYNSAEGALVSDSGMSWFPGYAIDIQTGERLNIVFGENSSQPSGRDMMWNPSHELFDASGNFLAGGMHTVYFFRTGSGNSETSTNDGSLSNYSDNGLQIYNMLNSKTASNYSELWKMCSWVWKPLGIAGMPTLATDVTLKLRMQEDYNKLTTDNSNSGYPMYEWKMDGLSTITSSADRLAEALDMINVVPNPYYAYSQYEANKFDNRIKITNIPENCTIQIFNVRGKKVKTIRKDNPLTSQDWDLKNESGIAVSSGVYLIHIEVPDVGEKILKLFIAAREYNFENF